MMMFPGIDLIEIDRFAQACLRQPRLEERLFTPRERAELAKKNWASKAARFAGKEAIFKTLGTGLTGLSWHDAEIMSNDLGEPLVYLSPRAQEIARQRGATAVRVSLTHTKELAAAAALLVAES